MNGKIYPYTSYSHAAGHVASAYCSRPGPSEASFVLAWDGGLFPRLYWVDPETGLQSHGTLFPMIGHAYAIASHHFGPFAKSPTFSEMSVAGKLMAYIARGQARESALAILREEFHRVFESDTDESVAYRRTIGGFGSAFEPSRPPVNAFFSAVRKRVEPIGLPDEDVLASMHAFLEELLMERIIAKVRKPKGEGSWNLCFTGGCALNIKWNSALRNLPDFRNVWVPPFPNDSGSAIGAAALGMIRRTGFRPIEWQFAARSGSRADHGRSQRMVGGSVYGGRARP